MAQTRMNVSVLKVSANAPLKKIRNYDRVSTSDGDKETYLLLFIFVKSQHRYTLRQVTRASDTRTSVEQQTALSPG